MLYISIFAAINLIQNKTKRGTGYSTLYECELVVDVDCMDKCSEFLWTFVL